MIYGPDRVLTTYDHLNLQFVLSFSLLFVNAGTAEDTFPISSHFSPGQWVGR